MSRVALIDVDRRPGKAKSMVCFNLEEELWTAVPGHEPYLESSNMGRVRTCRKGRTRILHPQKTSRGYLTVTFGMGGKRKKTVSIHRLVALSFVDNPHGHKEVDHINGRKEDNRASNLRWCTRSENMNNPNTPHGTPVVQIDIWGRVVREYDSVQQAAKALGVYNKSVKQCVDALTKTSCGFVFVSREKYNREIDYSPKGDRFQILRIEHSVKKEDFVFDYERMSMKEMCEKYGLRSRGAVDKLARFYGVCRRHDSMEKRLHVGMSLVKFNFRKNK